MAKSAGTEGQVYHLSSLDAPPDGPNAMKPSNSVGSADKPQGIQAAKDKNFVENATKFSDGTPVWEV